MEARPGATVRIVLTCLVCQMGLGLGGYVFAVFLKPIVADLGWTRASFSAAGSPLLLAMALASPLVGRLTERLGPRVVFPLGILVVAGALVGFSHMAALWHFWCWRSSSGSA
jgi:MFS family permease